MKTKITLMLVTVLLLAACAPKTSPTPAGTLPPIQFATAQSGEVKVSIASYAFDPALITITTGSTITWTNNDSVSHNVLADDGSWGSDSLAKGDSFSYTFTQAGTFSYHCGFHSSMKATITVIAP